MKPVEPTMWLGRHPLVSLDDIPELENSAAILEFKERMPREAAEAEAHARYTKERALDSAAHHLQGIRAAHASGAMEVARKHGAAYAAAAAVAGFEPVGPPPPEVTSRIDSAKPLHPYKAHSADILRGSPEVDQT